MAVMSTNTSNEDVIENEPQATIFGYDLWTLLTKYTNEEKGIMKSTKAMSIDGGCFVQVTTQQRNPDGSYAIAEAITFASNIWIHEVKSENGEIKRYLSRSEHKALKQNFK